jgi:Na+/H+ antiporter NhaA
MMLPMARRAAGVTARKFVIGAINGMIIPANIPNALNSNQPMVYLKLSKPLRAVK